MQATVKVALVHDWLTVMRGAEKVLEVLCELFPKADLYTLIYNQGKLSPIISNMNINTSFIENLPFAKRRYQYYLPLMPIAIEKFNMSGYNLIISSSHCIAKGIKKDRDSFHICYCHTPMRYIWEMYDEYFTRERIGFLKERVIRLFTQNLRKWDVESSKGVDMFIANSENVKRRISLHYNRDAEVIYPPVDTDFFTPQGTPRDFYLVVGALVPYKRVDLAIEAFNSLGYPLKIIGTGREEKRLRKKAKSNIEFLGWKEKEDLRDYYRNCRALIFPGEEDFGITPLEAQSCGKPVIAFGKGGALESVREGLTGIFFKEKKADSLINAIKQFEAMQFNPKNIRENAVSFKRSTFKNKISSFIEKVYKK